MRQVCVSCYAPEDECICEEPNPHPVVSGREFVDMVVNAQHQAPKLTDAEKIIYLTHELQEAQAEISRHHSDFQRIRSFLDDHDDELSNSNAEYHQSYAQACLLSIRNIVG